jgi:hypothetical protein
MNSWRNKDACPGGYEEKEDKMLANSDGVKKYLNQSLKGGDHG